MGYRVGYLEIYGKPDRRTVQQCQDQTQLCIVKAKLVILPGAALNPETVIVPHTAASKSGMDQAAFHSAGANRSVPLSHAF